MLLCGSVPLSALAQLTSLRLDGATTQMLHNGGKALHSLCFDKILQSQTALQHLDASLGVLLCGSLPLSALAQLTSLRLDGASTQMLHNGGKALH